MDESETAVDRRQPETAPRFRPANAFDQWFFARDLVHGQIDAGNVELLPLASIEYELRGLWNANEQIFAKALTDNLPHEHLNALRATLRDVESIAMEEGRLLGEQETSDVGASPPASRLQPWEPAFNERLRGVFDRKRRLLQTLLSLLTSAQGEVAGVAAKMRAEHEDDRGEAGVPRGKGRKRRRDSLDTRARDRLMTHVSDNSEVPTKKAIAVAIKELGRRQDLSDPGKCPTFCATYKELEDEIGIGKQIEVRARTRLLHEWADNLAANDENAERRLKRTAKLSGRQREAQGDDDREE